MMYFSGTIADVIEDGATATLILDTGRIKHQLHADSRLLAEALTALYGDDCIGKPAAVQCEGSTLTSIEIPARRQTTPFDLAEAYQRHASREQFEQTPQRFMVPHRWRTTLVRHLADAGFWKKC